MIEISSIMIYNEIKQEFKFARKFIALRIIFLFILYIYTYINTKYTLNLLNTLKFHTI